MSASGSFRATVLPLVRPGPLAPLAEGVVSALKAAKQDVATFEATTAGLIQAALQSVPGSSACMHCGAVVYNKRKAATLLGTYDHVEIKAADGSAYKQGKQVTTQSLARHKRAELGATWCIAESGACGPTFNYPEISQGFSAIFVSGPVERGIFVESPHNNREENMWGFAKAALDLLAECVAEAAAAQVAASEPQASALFEATEDRYGGVEIDVLECAAGCPVLRFREQLQRSLEGWRANGKGGIWLKVPLACAGLAGPAASLGFAFHHAKPEYVLLTRWLKEDQPSPLPAFAFTQIGVGGVVVNGRGEVLVVQERVSPMALFQDSWKLPGGLADPGEDFVETVQRELLEETGITSEFVGVVSIRHTHGVRFNMGDLYVLVKLRATSEEIRLDAHELKGAQWMSLEALEAITVPTGQKTSLAGKVSQNNLVMITNALKGNIIEGTKMENSRGPKPSMLYTAGRERAAM